MAALFANEHELQGLIAANPTLIPASACRSRDPRRWLLIQREAHIPNPATPNSPWAVDILLIDQDAIPTLVEVKADRPSTPTRRQHIGQLIDYLTSARSAWNATTLAAAYATNSGGNQQALAQHTNRDPNEFWKLAEQNLKRSRVRIIYAADRPPPGLIVATRYLNTQFTNTEAYAVRISRTEDGHAYGVIADEIEATQPPKPRTKRSPYPVIDSVELEAHLARPDGTNSLRLSEQARHAYQLGYIIKAKTNNQQTVLWLHPHADARALFTFAAHHLLETTSMSFDFSRATLQDAGLGHPKLQEERQRLLGALTKNDGHGVVGGTLIATDEVNSACADLLTWVAKAAGLTPRPRAQTG